MDLHKLFICNMKKWRGLSGLSQKSLAEKCGTGSSYIRQIESGVATPSLAMLAKIADALEIEPYQLLFNEDSGLGQAIRERYLEDMEKKLIKDISLNIQSTFDEMKRSAEVVQPTVMEEA